MAKVMTTASGQQVIGETVIRDKDNNLLVQFSSADAESFFGLLYERERIKYCMRHRRDNILMSLRKGDRPNHLVRECLSLMLKNILRR